MVRDPKTNVTALENTDNVLEFVYTKDADSNHIPDINSIDQLRASLLSYIFTSSKKGMLNFIGTNSFVYHVPVLNQRSAIVIRTTADLQEIVKGKKKEPLGDDFASGGGKISIKFAFGQINPTETLGGITEVEIERMKKTAVSYNNRWIASDNGKECSDDEDDISVYSQSSAEIQNVNRIELSEPGPKLPTINQQTSGANERTLMIVKLLIQLSGNSHPNNNYHHAFSNEHKRAIIARLMTGSKLPKLDLSGLDFTNGYPVVPHDFLPDWDSPTFAISGLPKPRRGSYPLGTDNVFPNAANKKKEPNAIDKLVNFAMEGGTSWRKRRSSFQIYREGGIHQTYSFLTTVNSNTNEESTDGTKTIKDQLEWIDRNDSRNYKSIFRKAEKGSELVFRIDLTRTTGSSKQTYAQFNKKRFLNMDVSAIVDDAAYAIPIVITVFEVRTIIENDSDIDAMSLGSTK